MFDPYILLAPIFLLPVVALLKFIGCSSFGGADIIPPVTTPTIKISNVPSGGLILGPGQSFQFEAKDSGGAVITDSADWKTDSGNFDKSQKGLYTALNEFGKTVTITATYKPAGSVAEPKDEITVSLVKVTVVITPQSAITNITPGQKFTLTVQVQGISDQSAIVTATAGLVSPNSGGGFTYQAPGPFNAARLSDVITASSKAAPGATPATLTIGLISGNRAEFVRVDDGTKGDWDLSYGRDGYALASLAPVPCTYFPGLAAALGTLGSPNPFAPDALDPKVAKGSATRVASAWHTTTDAVPLPFVFTFNDFAFHQVALYCRDHDNQGRKQQFEFFDDSMIPPAKLLPSPQSLDTFKDGKYLVFNISGTVRLQITHVASPGNAVLSGIFFGPKPV